MTKRGLKLGQEQKPLSKNQQEILNLLTNDFLTPKQIAQRRQTTTQAVYKIIRKLKDRGLISKGFTKGVAKSDAPLTFETPISDRIRLHGEEFNIKILGKTLKYDLQREKGNLLKIDDNTIKLYNNSIEVYSGKSFFGKDPQKATMKALKYWGRFFIRLENLLGVTLIKDKKNNIKVVNQHYSEINNEVAQDHNKRKEKLRIKGKDNKTWLLVDNSFQLNELETIHPKTAKNDIEKVLKQFNDWRDNNPMTLTEISHLVQNNAQGLNMLIEYNKVYAENIQSHIKAIQELGRGVNELNKLVKKISEKY